MTLTETLEHSPRVPLHLMASYLIKDGFGDSIVHASEHAQSGSFRLAVPTFADIIVVTDAELQRQLNTGADKHILGTGIGSVVTGALFDVANPSLLATRKDGLAINHEIRTNFKEHKADDALMAKTILQRTIGLHHDSKIGLHQAVLIATLSAYDDKSLADDRIVQRYQREIAYARMGGTLGTLALVGKIFEPAVKGYAKIRKPESVNLEAEADRFGNDRSSVLPGLLALGSATYWSLHRLANHRPEDDDASIDRFMFEVLRFDAAPGVALPRTIDDSNDRTGPRIIPSPYAALRSPFYGQDYNSFDPTRFVKNGKMMAETLRSGFGFGHRCPADSYTVRILGAVIREATDSNIVVSAPLTPRIKPMPPLKEPRIADQAFVVDTK